MHYNPCWCDDFHFFFIIEKKIVLCMHIIPRMKTKNPRIIGSPSFPQISAKYLAPIPNDTPNAVANAMFKHFDIVAPENNKNPLT